MAKNERTLKLFEFDREFVSRIKNERFVDSDASKQKLSLSYFSEFQDLSDLSYLGIDKNGLDNGRALVVGGCDEAGRGPLAGPLVCAACIMPLGDNEMIDGIYDSKGVTELRREVLFKQIIERAVGYSVSVIDCGIIDEINILNATKLGMSRAVDGLAAQGDGVDIVLVDAVPLDSKYRTVPLIKGDAKSYNIAAASIIAKVTRDKIMRELDGEYAVYRFGKNKGYGTAEHIAALKEHGACLHHRKTFVKNFVEYMSKSDN